MTILLTATGLSPSAYSCFSTFYFHHLGTKFVLLTSLAETTADILLQKVYEAYADAVMKNPFHTPEMPIRSEVFNTRISALIGSG
jgi:hypothetical protein